MSELFLVWKQVFIGGGTERRTCPLEAVAAVIDFLANAAFLKLGSKN